MNYLYPIGNIKLFNNNVTYMVEYVVSMIKYTEAAIKKYINDFIYPKPQILGTLFPPTSSYIIMCDILTYRIYWKSLYFAYYKLKSFFGVNGIDSNFTKLEYIQYILLKDFNLISKIIENNTEKEKIINDIETCTYYVKSEE